MASLDVCAAEIALGYRELVRMRMSFTNKLRSWWNRSFCQIHGSCRGHASGVVWINRPWLPLGHGISVRVCRADRVNARSVLGSGQLLFLLVHSSSRHGRFVCGGVHGIYRGRGRRRSARPLIIRLAIRAVPIGIGVPQGVVQDVRILVERLWIRYIGVRQRSRLLNLLTGKRIYRPALELIRPRKPPLRPREVPRPEVIEANYAPIPLLAGEQGSQ